MEITLEQLEKIKSEAERLYKDIGEVKCPYLNNGKVSFNAKGLDHIKFKEWNKARSPMVQYVRLRLLKFAPEVINKSHTLQEYYETKKFERRKKHSGWEKVLLVVRYYAFVAIINKCRIKIVVKEVDGGQPFFWSIIPFWKNNRANNESNEIYKKILHEGDLEIQ